MSRKNGDQTKRRRALWRFPVLFVVTCVASVGAPPCSQMWLKRDTGDSEIPGHRSRRNSLRQPRDVTQPMPRQAEFFNVSRAKAVPSQEDDDKPSRADVTRAVCGHAQVTQAHDTNYCQTLFQKKKNQSFLLGSIYSDLQSCSKSTQQRPTSDLGDHSHRCLHSIQRRCPKQGRELWCPSCHARVADQRGSTYIAAYLIMTPSQNVTYCIRSGSERLPRTDDSLLCDSRHNGKRMMKLTSMINGGLGVSLRSGRGLACSVLTLDGFGKAFASCRPAHWHREEHPWKARVAPISGTL